MMMELKEKKQQAKGLYMSCLNVGKSKIIFEFMEQ